MSLRIDVAQVTAVLLGDGQWHAVDRGTLELDCYEFQCRGEIVHSGGRSGVCATGFAFSSSGDLVCGPLSAILAVRLRGASRAAR